MKKTPVEFLSDLYSDGMMLVASGNTIISDLKPIEKELLDNILQYSEQAKACLAVVFTSLTYKFFNPDQDIRNHQASIPNGYSGRTFDQKNVTPFLKSQRFPYMQSGSGWLTRSFEQKVPFNATFSGAISPNNLKQVFLSVIEKIELGADCEEYLSYLLQGLIIKRNAQSIDLAKPTNLSINIILSILGEHFFGDYIAEGASRLPVLALYAAYQCLMDEVKRFDNKQLLPIESHTSSDKSSGRIGDIDILDERGREFEAVEVKYEIQITLGLVEDAYAKFQTTAVSRYYILSTIPSDKNEMIKVNEEIQRIKNVHGCQVIVNGVMPTLKYYLRLLDNTFEFVNNYVNLLEDDKALKFEHKKRWNEIISQLH